MGSGWWGGWPWWREPWPGWGPRIPFVERGAKLKMQNQGYSRPSGNSCEWWRRGLGNARMPQGWPRWADPLCGLPVCPFRWCTALPPWAMYPDMAQSRWSDPSLCRESFQPREKKVFKVKEDLFDICPSIKLSWEILISSAVSVQVWGQPELLQLIPLKEKSPKDWPGLSGVLVPPSKPFGWGLHHFLFL